MKPNINQKKAIENIEENILVNAGAGTGKTRVLVERYIWILNNGKLSKNKEIEGIVAITFTKKAAEEMKSRIRGELRKNFSKDTKWRRFYRDIEKSNISTIHSFCGNILRENPIEAKIDPMFKILDENEGRELLIKSINDVLVEEIENDLKMYELFKVLGLNTVNGLVDDIYSIYNDIRNSSKSIKDIEYNMIGKINGYSVKEDDLTTIEDNINLLKENLRKNAKIHKLKDDEKWLKFKNRSYDSVKELIEILYYIETFLGTSKKQKDVIDLIKCKILKVSKAGEIDNKELYEVVLSLLLKIDIQYNKNKEDISSLDYDDLQVKTLKLLKDNNDIRRYYQERYKYIMIDEFQDTNELQKEIFYLLASEKEKLDRGNLFVVGDPKQSIYGFRGADLEIFYNVMEDMEKIENGNIINLEENYRTSSSIMNFLNYVFENVMKSKYNKLNPNIKSFNEIEVEVLENKNLEIPEDETPSNYYRYYEAQMIAKRIRVLVDEEDVDYGDIALLFRAGTRNYIYEDALRDYNIPFYNVGGNSFFKEQEIIDLENAFKSILNPLDRISNIGFLRSSMIGLSDKVIFWILNENKDIFNSIKNLIDSDNEDIYEEIDILKDTLKLFEYMYEFKKTHTYTEILEEIVKITLFEELLLLQENGKQAIENISKYITFIDKYEKDRLEESEDIIEYLNKLKDRKESSAVVESEDSNVVKIMTIHKSKGLEFPVVIIPELSTKPNNNYSKIKYDSDLGLGLNIENNKALYESILEKEKEKEDLELERVLYVAMTRAERLLILGNQGNNLGFKKIISKYLNENHCTFIEDIEVDKNRKLKVSMIEDKYIVDKKEDEVLEYPNLIELDSYKKEYIKNSSITQYMTFKNCMREYYYKYKEKLDMDIFKDKSLKDNGISALEVGNLIHEFAEIYRIGLDEKLLIKNICYKHDIKYEKYSNILDKYIDNFLKVYDENYKKISREEEISIIINGIKFIGYIDRMDLDDGEIIITDYKTNKFTNKEKLFKYYQPQLEFYAYAVEKITGYKVRESKALFLENGYEFKVDLNKDKVNKTIKDIEGFAKFINEFDDIKYYNKSESCNPYCIYDIICNRNKK